MDIGVSGYGHGRAGRGGGGPGLGQVVCVRTRREPVAVARGHWEIENGLHHVKDRSRGEDASRSRRGATVLARLRSLAVGLLGHVEGSSTPLRQIAVAAHPLRGLRLLKQKCFPKLRRKDF